MNKRNKIIVSIVGITIVLLALLGITYAYYLTRIQGNTNTNSISITTADLKVEYRDGNGIITASNIMPGTMITGTDGKTFTVENSGNTKVDAYSVALDYAYLEDADGNVIVPSVFERPEDFKITLTCTSNIPDKSCNGYSGEFDNSNIIMRTNSIDAGEIHSYKLEIYYDNPDVDQSNDMGKLLNLKVQIYGVTGTADIKGSITGVNETNSVRLESDPKVSTIVKDGENYYYKFTGVEPGTHTLTIIDETGKELTNTNGDVVSQKIVVATGTSSGIGTTSIQDGVSTVTVPKITVTENERVVNLSTNIDKTSTTPIDINNITSTIETFNPYSGNKNSLAYHIINNAIYKNNGTKFLYYPETTPAKETSKITPTGKYKESTIIESYTTAEITDMMQLYTILFADTEEEACNGTIITTILSEYVGKYACIKEENVVFHIDYYNVKSDSFKISGKYKMQLTTEEFIQDAENNSFLFGNTIEEACKGVSTSSNFQEQVGKYVCLKDLSFSFYIESYDSSKDIFTLVRWEEIMDTEKTLSVTEDDFGSSYYFRGDVKDNYVNFADMCWKIVRIQGDGSVKLLLEDQMQVCSTNMLSDFILRESNYGFADSDRNLNFLSPSYLADKSMVKTFYDFQSAFTHEEITKLQTGNWCIEEGITNSLKCEGISINKFVDVTYDNTKIINAGNMYVGTLTANEVIFAGASTNLNNQYFYINPKSFINTLTKINSKNIYSIGDYNVIYDNGLVNNDIIPSIVLKSDIEVTGDGTINNPYVIK